MKMLQLELKPMEFEELRQEILKGYEQSQRGKSEPFDIEAIKAIMTLYSPT